MVMVFVSIFIKLWVRDNLILVLIFDCWRLLLVWKKWLKIKGSFFVGIFGFVFVMFICKWDVVLLLIVVYLDIFKCICFFFGVYLMVFVIRLDMIWESFCWLKFIKRLDLFDKNFNCCFLLWVRVWNCFVRFLRKGIILLYWKLSCNVFDFSFWSFSIWLIRFKRFELFFWIIFVFLFNYFFGFFLICLIIFKMMVRGVWNLCVILV